MFGIYASVVQQHFFSILNQSLPIEYCYVKKQFVFLSEVGISNVKRPFHFIVFISDYSIGSILFH